MNPRAAPTPDAPTPDRPALGALLARLEALHPRVIDLSLERILRLLDDLGRPHTILPPVLHVAGTNGKGSTIAICRAVLEAAGCRVHAYTSPHLVHFSERIVLGGAPIEEDPLLELLLEAEAANAGRDITFFEITTAAAYLAFSRTPADILLLETGLGGRLDATNVIDRPRLTAITPVGVDHQSFLGHRLHDIAAEKAGILKSGVPCIVVAQPAPAMRAIEERARAVGAPLVVQGQDWRVRRRGGTVRFSGARRKVDVPALALPGAHQAGNLGAAFACLEQLDELAIRDDHLRTGAAEARWPGRLQRLAAGPLVEGLPPGWSVWVDGGHNRQAAGALARWARTMEAPVDLVIGLLRTKSPRGFLSALRRDVRSVAAVPIDGHDAFAPGEIVKVADDLGVPARAAASPEAAVRTLTDGAERPGHILIGGSLYLVGSVLAENA